MANLEKLHLGCGLNTPDGWINVDGSWNARLTKLPLLRRFLRTFRIVPMNQLDIRWQSDIYIHDVRKPLPFADRSMQAIYASHLLEHLYLEEATRFLKECYRVLRPDGVVRLVVSDLRAILREYWGEKPFSDVPVEMLHLNPADRLNKRLLLRSVSPPSGGILYRLYTLLQDFHSHKWMYDANSLCEHLRLAGFVNVGEMGVYESRIHDIEKIEIPERVLNGAGVCVEGMKPHVED